MAEQARLVAKVLGWVQGVGFRHFVFQSATVLGLKGYVRNLRDEEAVEVVAQGERLALERLLDDIKVGPRAARVSRVEARWEAHVGDFRTFEIGF